MSNHFWLAFGAWAVVMLVGPLRWRFGHRYADTPDERSGAWVRTLEIDGIEVDFGRWVTTAEADEWAARYREALPRTRGMEDRV